MDDTLLIRLSVGLSAIGLIVLFILSASLRITDADPAALLDTGPLSVQGTVTDVEYMDSMTRITLKTECFLPVVIFGQADAGNGSVVRVYGTLTRYKEKNEILAEKITWP